MVLFMSKASTDLPKLSSRLEPERSPERLRRLEPTSFSRRGPEDGGVRGRAVRPEPVAERSPPGLWRDELEARAADGTATTRWSMPISTYRPPPPGMRAGRGR